jgi:ABC-type antimicrobial peptide transport system permease subunit
MKMEMPWANKTGIAKLVAIFATALGIAAGLCGANFVAVMLVPLGGPGPQAPPTLRERISDAVGATLSVTAYLELATILISLAALIVLGLILLFRPRK